MDVVSTLQLTYHKHFLTFNTWIICTYSNAKSIYFTDLTTDLCIFFFQKHNLIFMKYHSVTGEDRRLTETRSNDIFKYGEHYRGHIFEIISTLR